MGQCIFCFSSFAPDFQEHCWTLLKVRGNFDAQISEKSVPLLQTQAASDASPAVSKFQLPFSHQPELPALSLANSALQLRVINAKLFGIWKPKAWGQQKINWIAKGKSAGNSPDCITQLCIYLIKTGHFLIKTQPLQNFPAAVLRGKGGVRAHRSGPGGGLGQGMPRGAQAAGLQGSALPSNAARWYWRLPALKPPWAPGRGFGGLFWGARALVGGGMSRPQAP